MEQEIDQPKPARKVLSLKKEGSEAQGQPCFIYKDHAVFMVWRDGGNLPTRIYGPDERKLAINHAKNLCIETGARFHVLRSYRAFDPVVQ